MSRPGPRNKYADYRPSEKLLDAVKAWEDAIAEAVRLRHAARAAIADELRESGVSHGTVAQYVPWTSATVSGIAQEYGVPSVRARKSTGDE